MSAINTDKIHFGATAVAGVSMQRDWENILREILEPMLMSVLRSYTQYLGPTGVPRPLLIQLTAQPAP